MEGTKENTWECVMGLEVHVELSTDHKAFCTCETSFGDVPNSHTCPVCLGMPGALPVLNQEVVESAVLLGLALGCQIEEYITFDRKNYFYPDNPKNYQITQLERPICTGGSIEIESALGKRRIRIREIHMEEDAGKISYGDLGQVLLDFNRAGIPLLEIVTMPDLRNEEEVVALLEYLRRVVQYLGISDGRLQEGSLRADVNLSVRKKGTDEMGVRTETKNLNSYKAIRQAIAEEYERQVKVLESGGEVCMETRHWDEGLKQGIAMRPKETIREYRYVTEPDLPPLRLSRQEIKEIGEGMPMLHEERARALQEKYGIEPREAELLTQDREMADLLEELMACGAGVKISVNWMMGEVIRLMREKGIYASDLKIEPKSLACLLKMLENRSISNTVAKEVFERMYEDPIDPETYIRERGLQVSRNQEELIEVIHKVVDENDKSVKDYLGGKKQALGFLIGQTMKAVKGAADPEQLRSLLQEMLDQMV